MSASLRLLAKRLSAPAPGRAVPQTEKPQHSGLCETANLRALGAPKGDALLEISLSQAEREERNDKICASRRSMPLMVLGAKLKVQPARGAGIIARGWKWLFEN